MADPPQHDDGASDIDMERDQGDQGDPVWQHPEIPVVPVSAKVWVFTGEFPSVVAYSHPGEPTRLY